MTYYDIQYNATASKAAAAGRTPTNEIATLYNMT